MFYANRVKGVNLVRIISLFIILSIFLLNLSNFNIYQTNNHQDKDSYQYSNENLGDLKTSDYSSNLEGIGGDLNISLQQSLVDTTLTSIINTTDITNNTFTVACPTDSDFNSTYTYIEVENIVSHNKTLVIEEPNNINNGSEGFSQGKVKATSFKIDQDAYLENVSVYITSLKNKFCGFLVVLFNTSWVGGQTEPNGGETEYHAVLGEFNYTAEKSTDYVGWFNCRNIHYYLNNSLTDNNTWCIGLVESGESKQPSNPEWFYVPDSVNGDNSDSYTISGNTWTLFNPGDFVDMMTMLTFNKASMFPVADLAEVGFKINGTAINGIGDTGIWNSTEKVGSASGKLKFKVTADWDSLECNIKLVQINYTKTNLKAISSFNVLGSGQDIFWNVSPINELNFFDSRLIRNRINFTIPITWSKIKVYNGSLNKTDNILSFSLNNGFKIIQVSDAGNGTNWFLNAISTNLIQSLDTLIGSTPVTTVNFTDIINFNVTFSKTIAQNDGTINLSIYSPAVISNKLNYTTAKSTFSEGVQFSLGSWDISENVTHCGIFRIQIFWNNDTAAGFLEKTLAIVGRTELTIMDPPNNSFYNPTDIFNITLYFNDTGADQGIDGADINIEVNGSTYTTNTWDIQNGNYKIRINCSDPEFSTLGWYEIKINTTKQFYYNQSEVIIIKIITATTPKVTIETPSDGSSFDNTANIEINVTITDQDGFISNVKAMINATTSFNITMNFMSGKWTCIWGNTSEYIANDYNITIWAIDDDENINQTEFVIITIIDIIAPTWDETPTDRTIELGTFFSYDLNATDLQSVTYSVNNTSNFAIDANGVITNNTVLSIGDYYLEINATDASNNVLTRIIIITVEDTTAPTWDQTPQNQTVELGQSFSYDLNATDYQAITYSINDTSNFAIDANGVITNNTVLSLGVYFLEINATDASNNILTIIIIISVTDTDAPQWDEIPQDHTIELDQSFSYDLNATDVQTVIYSVNDTTNFSIAVNGVLTNNTVLSVGSYHIEVTASDGINDNKSIIIITVEDTTAPTWDEIPQNQTVELGQSFSYDVNATDLQAITYTVNDTSNFAIDANGVITNNTALSIGSYSLEINAKDASNNVLTRIITFTVEDTTAPIWDELPADQTVELGQPFSYDVDASDLQSITYSVNNTTKFAIDANGVITNNTILSLSSYSIQISATDASNNVLTRIITIKVEDTTAPTWDVVPSDQTVELGQPFSYDVNASDLQSITYSVNDTSNFAIDANGVITDNTILSLGVYSLEINATDASNNMLIKIIAITVEDTTAPIWVETPTSEGVLLGQPFNYNVNATDLQSIAYSVNDTSNFAIDANGVIVNNTVLNFGSYSLEINATDASNNVLTIIIIISVTDTDAPQWDEMPQDQTIELGTLLSYDLNATDVLTVIYSVNDTTNFSIDANGILTNNTILGEGYYHIEVTASDGMNDNTTIIIITVEDTTAPTWNELPADQTVELGQPFSYDVNATDLQFITYFVNNTSNFAIDANGLITNNTVLSIGDYYLEINATDASNNVLTRIIIITVEDTTAPTWDETPQNQTVELGQSFSYDVNATDLQAITYTVNDTSNFAIDANGVITNNTILSLGLYTLQINATDASVNMLTVYITINVNDTMAPIWDEMPQDQIIEFGSLFNYDINATDLQSVTYSVNDTINFAMDGNGVLTNNTLLTVGPYPIEVIASDGTNDNTTIITITVQDTIAPIWVETPQDQTIELGNSFNYEVNASDLSGIAQYWVNVTINFQIDGSGVITNATALSVGIYWLMINTSDPYDNNCSRIIKITVEHTINPPSAKIIIPLSGNSFTNTLDIEINATITDDGSVVNVKAMINATMRFNITMQSGAANKWTCTWDNVSLYDAGDYKITIWAMDNEGNINQTEYVVITLKDVINPSVTIVTPSDWRSFNNSNIIEINATIIDIGSSITDVKAMINTSIPLNITMLVINNMWTCTWDNTSVYDAGIYKITIWAIDEWRNINQTEEINIKLFGLTSLYLINLTEYNIIISLNGTIYEAYTGQNITIYANFVCLYPYKLIKGALGLLMFNGVNYYDNDIDNNGLYSWVINTSQLKVNSYEFNVSFSKIFYQNITSKIKFDLNKLLTQITLINQPSTVICGNDCNLTIGLNNLLTSDPIINENVSLLLDFGISQTNITAKTSAIGILTYNISIPENATKLDFTIQYLGNEIYTASEVVSSVNIQNNGEGNESGGGDSDIKKKPVEPEIDILLIAILLIIGFIALGSVAGYVIVTKRTAAEKRILIIRNDSQKDLKLIFEVLEKFDLSYEVTEISNLAEITEIDNSSLIVMIGLLNNRGINTEHPDELKTLINRALRKNIPIIGVGSGIQIFAEYLGENLISYPIEEIGFKHKNTWYTVKLTEESSDDQIFKTINDNFIIFQFYNEKFEVSKGLANLGKIQSCKNQIIKFGEALYGFQIHFELSEYLVNHFLDNAPELNNNDWNRLKLDYNQIIQSYSQRGKKIFIDYLKLIKLIKDIEIKKIEQAKSNESDKHLEKLLKHIDIKTNKSENEKFTTTNLDALRKKIDSRIKKL